MGVVRRLRCMDTRVHVHGYTCACSWTHMYGHTGLSHHADPQEPGTGHHTVPPLNLATDISKLPIVGIGVSIL